jgi:hypothetical protein
MTAALKVQGINTKAKPARGKIVYAQKHTHLD